MARTESLSGHVATAGVIVAIAAIGLAALVRHENSSPEHHHPKPHISQHIGMVGLQGGVEAPPAANIPGVRNLTSQEIQVTGGTLAP